MPAATKEKEQEVGKREQARIAREELEAKQRKAKIESGDLIVKGEVDYEAAAAKSAVAGIVAKLIARLQKATKTPVVTATIAKELGYKYPEDLAPALYALEALGLARRFEVRKGAGRPTAAYLWTGE